MSFVTIATLFWIDVTVGTSFANDAVVAQLVEHLHGKGEGLGSIPDNGPPCLLSKTVVGLLITKAVGAFGFDRWLTVRRSWTTGGVHPQFRTIGQVPKRSNGTDCKSVGSRLRGSNLPPTTPLRSAKGGIRWGCPNEVPKKPRRSGEGARS